MTEVVKFANGVLYRGGVGTNDNDVVFTADQISECDSFMLSSSAGAMDVLVSLDGVNYETSAHALQDLNAADLTPVLVTAAGKSYGFRGKFLGIKVLQNGATAVANAALVGGNLGSRW